MSTDNAGKTRSMQACRRRLVGVTRVNTLGGRHPTRGPSSSGKAMAKAGDAANGTDRRRYTYEACPKLPLENYSDN